MKTRMPRFGVCQDCIEKLPNKVLLRFDVENTKFGPEHSIVLCKNCKAKRENP